MTWRLLYNTMINSMHKASFVPQDMDIIARKMYICADPPAISILIYELSLQRSPRTAENGVGQGEQVIHGSYAHSCVPEAHEHSNVQSHRGWRVEWHYILGGPSLQGLLQATVEMSLPQRSGSCTWRGSGRSRPSRSGYHRSGGCRLGLDLNRSHDTLRQDQRLTGTSSNI